jgi:aspartate/methionine/tyrosine aminotransferase
MEITMQTLPIHTEVVSSHIEELGLKSLKTASIREVRRLVNNLEQKTGTSFIHMEMGIPGMKTPEVAIEAEIKALKAGCASLYPDVEGTPELKHEMSRFIKNFLDLSVSPRSCVPTTGSMHGGYIAMMLAGRVNHNKDTVLFIDPGFPVQKQQAKIIGLRQQGFDVYHYRGDKLEGKLRSYLATGKIACIVYSNPNNPSWICLNQKELKIIGELATEYDCIVIEDLAYFAMDFRKEISKPGGPNFQASVGKYTDNYILLISTSKSFSYAGQRIGILGVSDRLFNANFDALTDYFSSPNFGHSLVYGALYGMSAGITHSTQYGLAALLKEVNEGRYNFYNDIKHYGHIATLVKPLFTESGFQITYDKDEDVPLADGFYFTVSYPGFTSEELVNELLHYGISAVPLSITGSTREGIRACMSLITEEQIPVLASRLALFKKNHPVP